MDVRAIAASTTTPTTDAPSTPTAARAETARKSFATLFAEAKDDLKTGEKLTKVDGHPFARIKGGTRDDMCINLSGNERSGQAFDLIWRDGRQFHVYGGTGADHKVVEVGHKAADKTAADKTTSSGTTTAAAGATGGTTSPSTGTSTTKTSSSSSSS
jgi:hypothetical protein